MLKLLNNLYSPLEDPFKTGEDVGRQIRYEEVESSPKKITGITFRWKRNKTITVFEANDKTEIGKQVGSLIQELIHGNYTIERG